MAAPHENVPSPASDDAGALGCCGAERHTHCPPIVHSLSPATRSQSRLHFFAPCGSASLPEQRIVLPAKPSPAVCPSAPRCVHPFFRASDLVRARVSHADPDLISLSSCLDPPDRSVSEGAHFVRVAPFRFQYFPSPPSHPSHTQNAEMGPLEGCLVVPPTWHRTSRDMCVSTTTRPNSPPATFAQAYPVPPRRPFQPARRLRPNPKAINSIRPN